MGRRKQRLANLRWAAEMKSKVLKLEAQARSDGARIEELRQRDEKANAWKRLEPDAIGVITIGPEPWHDTIRIAAPTRSLYNMTRDREALAPVVTIQAQEIRMTLSNGVTVRWFQYREVGVRPL